MSEVIWVAAISSASGLLGVAIGALANVWGPAAVEGRRRVSEQRAAEDAERRAAALAFVESLALIAAAQNVPQRMHQESVRLRFVATLRKGELGADAFTLNLAQRVHENRVGSNLSMIVQMGSSMLFGWMRGERAIEDLTDAKLTEALFPVARGS